MMEERNFKLPEKLTMGHNYEPKSETKERTSRFSDKPVVSSNKPAESIGQPQQQVPRPMAGGPVMPIRPPGAIP